MKAKQSFYVFVFGAVAMFASGCAREGVVNPSDAVPAADIIQVRELKLTIAPEKERYFVGEPIYIRIRLENQGQRAVRVLNRLWPGEGGVTIAVELPAGRTRTFVPLGYSDFDASAYVELKPGESIGDIFPIFYGGEGWTFREAGEYSLEASYLTSNADRGYWRVVSPATKIVVVSDQRNGAQLVNQGKPSIEAGKFLVWSAGDHLLQGRALLDQILEETPESPLASYIYAALGRSMSEPFSNYVIGEVRAANCEQAFNYFGRVNQRVITDYVRSQIALAKTRCALTQRDWDGAKIAIADFRRIAADLPEYAGTRLRLVEYETYLHKQRE